MTLSAAMLLAALLPAPLAVLDASGNVERRTWAADGDPATSWVGYARREPAWITFKLKTEGPVAGVRLHLAPMPANTYAQLDVSADGRRWVRVLRDLRLEADAATTRFLDTPVQAGYLRLELENGSRQPVIGFAVREVEVLREQDALLASPSVAPTPAPLKLHGAVWGRHEGHRVLVIVGNRMGAVRELRAAGRSLRILATASTQVLCLYPYARPERLLLWAQVGDEITTRTVVPVGRPIRWPPPESF